jgi:hypothetical protein
MTSTLVKEKVVTIKVTENARKILRRHAKEIGMKQYKLAEEAIVDYYRRRNDLWE